MFTVGQNFSPHLQTVNTKKIFTAVSYQKMLSLGVALYSPSMAKYCHKSVLGYLLGVWGEVSIVPTVTDKAGCGLAGAWGGGGEGAGNSLCQNNAGVSEDALGISVCVLTSV